MGQIQQLLAQDLQLLLLLVVAVVVVVVRLPEHPAVLVVAQDMKELRAVLELPDRAIKAEMEVTAPVVVVLEPPEQTLPIPALMVLPEVLV
jgi:hypothetical protein